jgi:hypothetical protein
MHFENTAQSQTQQNQLNAPANSRTDVVLYSNEYTPKPSMVLGDNLDRQYLFWRQVFAVNGKSQSDNHAR